MFKNKLCGVNTGHRKGFVHRSTAPQYLLLSFKTPFFAVLNGIRVEGRAGDAILHRPGSTVIHGPLAKNEQFVNDWIHFSTDAEQELASLPLKFDTVLCTNQTDVIEMLISDIISENVRNDRLSERLISDMLYRLLSVMARSTPREHREESLFSKFETARVHILHAYGEEWTLEKMAALTGYSVSRFCALYTELFGISPMNDLLEARLKNAKALLSLHAYKVGDVAKMCGFSSIHYFSCFIKKHTGKSPSDF